MIPRPYNLYTPTKTATGKGGFEEALGTGRLIWGIPRVHENETFLIVKIAEPVKIGDVVTAKEEIT